MPNLILPKYRLLYHFTAAQSLNSIKREGLWKGGLPWQRDPDGNPCVIRHKNETRCTAAQLAKLNAREAELAANGRRYWRPGFQWLTSNPSFDQPWCLLGSLPYPKNAYRLKFLIPETALHRLFKWSEFCARGKPDCEAEINVPAVDWQNWFIFYGPMPTTWLIETPLRNVGHTITAELDGDDAKQSLG
jgi:hypothetical protein